MDELVGIAIFSGFMLILVSVLVGNVLLALYRERKQRKDAVDAQGGGAGD
jgi:hypothetical protein